MPRKTDPQEFLNNVFVKYVAAPIIVVLGMIIVGSIIDGALGTGKAFTVILASAGGIGVIGSYFSNFWKHGK